jgi:protein-L-isoaspartate(D-aspartate) O-methyltransferase
VTGAGPDAAERLREGLLARVRANGGARDPAVAAALLAVPRHVFLPEVPVPAAYRDDAIVTRRDDEGLPVSSSSQPTIMAIMLDQLAVAPGHRVLEIGAGTGYNAALLAHLVGPAGAVTSVDIDPDVVDRARAGLAAAGAGGVRVVAADGAAGWPAGAPYDRIIATVGVWDLAPAWAQQLAPGGRLVAPLDLYGVQVSLAFEPADGHWASRSAVACGFMRLRGPAAGPERTRVLDRDSGLAVILPDGRAVDTDAVRAALAAPPVIHPTGVRDDGVDRMSGLGLWLALTEPRSCALVEPGRPRSVVGLLDWDSIALVASAPVAGPPVVVHGHGPAGERLAADLAARVRAWEAAGRPAVDGVRVSAWPAGTPDLTGGFVIDKVHTRLVVAPAGSGPLDPAGTGPRPDG